MLNFLYLECDKYKLFVSNFVLCGNGIVMVNMERYWLYEFYVVILYNKNLCKKILCEIYVINFFMLKIFIWKDY